MRKITKYAYESHFQTAARSVFVPSIPFTQRIMVFKNQLPGVMEQATACTITQGLQTQINF